MKRDSLVQLRSFQFWYLYDDTRTEADIQNPYIPIIIEGPEHFFLLIKSVGGIESVGWRPPKIEGLVDGLVEYIFFYFGPLNLG